MAKGNKASKECLDEKIELFAHAMVNRTYRNKSASYKYTLLSIGYKEEDLPTNIHTSAFAFYERHKERIEKRMNELCEEARKNEANIRDDNIKILKEIIESTKSDKDRMQALKMLNEMMGLNTQNINLKAEQSLEVEII